MDLTAGTLIGGKYELERALADGGMGSIWVARHTELCSRVAIKFIAAAYAGSPVLRSRFIREARAAAQIVSAHVVRVHDYGVHDDTPYLVMELLAGEDLGARLRRAERLPLDVSSRLCTQIARGLRRAHKAGFVHRDLKPSNIFLARIGDEDEEEEIVKILDFGVAKETRQGPLDECTKTGEIMGSPHYMSPEQIHESKDIDARSDLWSLGVILYRAITGELPFPGDAAGLVMSKILTDPIPLPSERGFLVPPAVDSFFFRAFQRDPELRFQSAREMAEAFAEATGAVRSTRLSWTFLGPSLALRDTIACPPPGRSTSLAPPSSTIPAPMESVGTLRSAFADPEAATEVSGVAPPCIMEPSLAPNSHSIHQTGTLTAALRVVDPAVVKPRRSLLGWAAGAAGVAGVVVGWCLIGLLSNPSKAATAADINTTPAVAHAAVEPLSPAFSIAAPMDPAIDFQNAPTTGRSGASSSAAGSSGATSAIEHPSGPAFSTRSSASRAPAGTNSAEGARPGRFMTKRPRLGF